MNTRQRVGFLGLSRPLPPHHLDHREGSGFCGRKPQASKATTDELHHHLSMKTKPELIAALTAKGVPCDDTMTVVILQELATKNGIDLKKEKADAGAGDGGGRSIETTIEKKATPAPAAAAADDIEWRVRAGLTRDQAIEVAARQRETDAAVRK
jgi:hypothetical protein